MPLGCRSSIGALAGLAVALALPVAATACTPEEYMSPEDRGSGRYDTTPPDYYGGSDAPHTHGDATTGSTGTEPLEYGLGGSAERADSRGDRKAGGRGERAGDNRQRSAPAPATSAPAAVPAAPAPVATEPLITATQPAVTATQPAVTAAAARRAEAAARAAARRKAAEARAAARARAARALAVERRQVWAEARSDRPSLTFAPAPAELSAATPAPADRQDATRTWFAALAAGLALLAALAGGLAARRSPTAVHAPGLDAEIEAELQEILAEENARRVGAPLGPPE